MHETPASYVTRESKKNLFEIPPGLRFEDGPFEHQGKAVNAWCDAAFRGVLEMATGSGKTIAAMIAANKLYSMCKPLLIVIAAPYIPLIQQWCDEIVPFGISPTNLTESSGPKGRANELARIGRRFRHGLSSVEAIVVSYHSLTNHEFRAKIADINCTTLLIGDEVHNLGSEGFVSDPPIFFDYRLGLSATPIRQYDQEGTEALLNFFGPVVYRYGLEEAIGNCLVEYDYHIHPVELTIDEIDQWSELTARIMANSWRAEDGNPDEYLAKLFRDRRLILETAENKIDALRDALATEHLPSLSHTLIYGSDKDPGQLEAINRLLKENRVLFHQLTYRETSNREQTKRIIESFQEGALRVLTAKRVLDEGVNIPQIQKAFILASTTVERQWVQRRGRLLRRCAEIGKTHSVLHDFIALPPNLVRGDTDIRALVRSELRRVQEFASLARNAGRPNGPLTIIDELVEAAYF
jgi:superfamily II DNA or RNA helicase